MIITIYFSKTRYTNNMDIDLTLNIGTAVVSCKVNGQFIGSLDFFFSQVWQNLENVKDIIMFIIHIIAIYSDINIVSNIVIDQPKSPMKRPYISRVGL